MPPKKKKKDDETLVMGKDQKAIVTIEGDFGYSFSSPEELSVPKTPEEMIQYACDIVYCTGKPVNNHTFELFEGKYNVFDGNLFFPARQIIGCLKFSAFLKKHKLQGSVERCQEIINRGITVGPEEILFDPLLTFDDIVPTKRPIFKKDRSAGMLHIYKARLKPRDWRANFEISFPHFFPQKELKDILDFGGTYACIGGERPYKGKFKTTKWKMV